MIQFVRQRSFQYMIQEPLSQRRGFSFDLIVGLSKDVDSMSGMTVNLTDVDTWISDFLVNLPLDKSAPELLIEAKDFLQEKAQKVGAKLTEVSLWEQRQWKIQWNQGLGKNQILQICSHYFECFHPQDQAVFKLLFCWRASLGVSIDFSSKSLQLLKESNISSNDSLSEILQKLKRLVGDYSSEASLTSIKIEHPRFTIDI